MSYRLFVVCVCVRREEKTVVIYLNVKRILTVFKQRLLQKSSTHERNGKLSSQNENFALFFGTEQNENWLFNLESLGAGL